MADDKNNEEKARQIVNLLSKENCGYCGFGNCERFALAVIDGKALPFGCHENPLVVYEIKKVLGKETPKN